MGADRASLGSNGSAPGRLVSFWCPGCDEAHMVTVESPVGWDWNGDLERPTFSPSVKVTGVKWDAESPFCRPQHHVEVGQMTVCHSFVTDGRIQFLTDSTHELAGQTVDLPDWRSEDL